MKFIEFPKSSLILHSADAKIMYYTQSWYDEDMKHFIILMDISEYGGQYILNLPLISNLK